ncbi:MAG: hypothetical protein Q7R90_02000 [bacterium]|nr:hypothetical protein [bacterium]
MSRTTSFRFLLIACVVFAVLPFLAHAQNTSADLRATIRAELLSDPRTSSLSDAQIDALVSLLADEAEKQGVTSQDIQWRPQSSERFVATESAAPQAPECAGGFLCTMTEAFGFVGADTTIPFTLGAASMGLVWILAEMIHRRRHPYVSAAPSSGV